MTIAHARPQMGAEEFERLAAAAERDDIRLEFIHGELGVKAAPDGDHDEIIIWVTEHGMQQRPDLRLHSERGLKVETYRTGHARPDGTPAPRRTFRGQGEWASADQVLTVVEVTSYDFDTDKRDREERPRAHAETGTPVYLLVDRTPGEVVVYSAPEPRGGYAHLDRHVFGAEVRVPEPVGVVPDTEPLKGWVR